jgi:hypothetical protein
LLGLGVSDSRITFKETPFTLLKIIYPQEDAAANPLHLLLIVVGVFVLLKRSSWRNRPALLVFFLTLISFLLFAGVLRWQLFNIRLQIPFFVLGIISGGIILSTYKIGRKILYLMVGLSMPLAVILVLLNFSRPYISYRLFLNKIGYFVPEGAYIPQAFYERSRDMQYFNPRWYWYEPYRLVAENIAQNNNHNFPVSFRLMDQYEYPFWIMLKQQGLEFKVVPISQADSGTYIISTSPSPFIDMRYNTLCYPTRIEYGYACVSKMKEN